MSLKVGTASPSFAIAFSFALPVTRLFAVSGFSEMPGVGPADGEGDSTAGGASLGV